MATVAADLKENMAPFFNHRVIRLGRFMG